MTLSPDAAQPALHEIRTDKAGAAGNQQRAWGRQALINGYVDSFRMKDRFRKNVQPATIRLIPSMGALLIGLVLAVRSTS